MLSLFKVFMSEDVLKPLTDVLMSGQLTQGPKVEEFENALKQYIGNPYILTLTERDYHEVIAKGDGSKAEDISKSVKVDVKYIKSLNPSDLITDYMLMKIKEYLNQ